MKIGLPAVLSALVVAPAALGDFVVPDGSNFPWVRGATANSAYAQWETFTSPGGPNSPEAGLFVGGTLPAGAPAWDAFDASGQSILTSGGNIYSFAAPLNIHVAAPNFGLGTPFSTTVLLQVRTQGNEIDSGSVNIGGVPPTETRELFRQELGNPGGFLVETLYRWELPGNAAGYEVRFDSALADMSLDRVAIDTFAHQGGPACYANCDQSTMPPVLNINDFICFQSKFAAGDPYANCDQSTTPPVLNVNDFICFQTSFAAGCP